MAAALQLRAHNRTAFPSVQASLLEQIRLAACDSDLLVLPESTFPAYVLGDTEIDDTAVASALEEVRRIASAARCVIVAGAAIRRERDLYNSAVVIDRDGTIAGYAEKIFLWQFDGKWFAPGERLEPIHTSLGALGVLVCADGRMPGIARALVDRGAQALVMPTAWVTSGRDSEALENIQADLLGRVRAFENGVPFVAANKCGVEREMVAYCGKSQIVDRNGETLAIASERDQTLLRAQITLGSAAAHRTTIPTPAVRIAASDRPIRIVLTTSSDTSDLDERMRILDADVAIGPGRVADVAALDRGIPTVDLDAAAAYDPGFLLVHRAAGYRCAILRAAAPDPWLTRIARARALELRMYVIVIIERADAFAIDPDGAVIAGTYNDYRYASFTLDPKRTAQTVVAPGTDIAAGIERVASLVRHKQ